MIADIHTLTMDDFRALPLVIEGESKEVRYAGGGKVIIYFKPTVYSFTENRCAIVPNSNKIRLKASEEFVKVLSAAGVRHAYEDFSEDFVLAKMVVPCQAELDKYGAEPYVPNDITAEEYSALPRAPSIEVVIKRYLTGTTKHGCIGLAGSEIRKSHPFYSGMMLEGDGALPELLVRFDWRNPLRHRKNGERMADALLDRDTHDKTELWDAVIRYGERMADTVLPPQLADLIIDVSKARRTAFIAATAIEDFLASKKIVFYDLCMFIDESGEMVYGEVSPDCGRYRHLDLGSLDKDVWRSGGSSAAVLLKWAMLYVLISGDGTESPDEVEAAAARIVDEFAKTEAE